PARLVVVRHAQALPARDADTFRRWVTAPNPAACLMLLADEALTPNRERKTPHWLLDVVPAAAVVALVARRGRPLEEWLRQRAQAEGLVVSEEGARLLVQHVGEDSATLLGEVRKAALAGGPENRAVGVKEVSAVVGEHRLSGLFDLTRAVERHELGLALRTLDRLLGMEDPLPLLVALTRDVRMRWTVREGRGRRRPAAGVVARARRRSACRFRRGRRWPVTETGHAASSLPISSAASLTPSGSDPTTECSIPSSLARWFWRPPRLAWCGSAPT